jgi:hypothetical protein
MDHNAVEISGFLVGWVELPKYELLVVNFVGLPDYTWIAEYLNPTRV